MPGDRIVDADFLFFTQFRPHSLGIAITSDGNDTWSEINNWFRYCDARAVPTSLSVVYFEFHKARLLIHKAVP